MISFNLYLMQLAYTISLEKDDDEASREADQRCYATFQTVLEGKSLNEILEKCRKDLEYPKIGRNDPCPCGSGKKYKHCCGK